MGNAPEEVTGLARWLALREVKVNYVTAAIAYCNGDRLKAAKLVGVSLKTVYNLVPVVKGKK